MPPFDSDVFGHPLYAWMVYAAAIVTPLIIIFTGRHFFRNNQLAFTLTLFAGIFSIFVVIYIAMFLLGATPDQLLRFTEKHGATLILPVFISMAIVIPFVYRAQKRIEKEPPAQQDASKKLRGATIALICAVIFGFTGMKTSSPFMQTVPPILMLLLLPVFAFIIYKIRQGKSWARYAAIGWFVFFYLIQFLAGNVPIISLLTAGSGFWTLFSPALKVRFQKSDIVAS